MQKNRNNKYKYVQIKEKLHRTVSILSTREDINIRDIVSLMILKEIEKGEEYLVNLCKEIKGEK